MKRRYYIGRAWPILNPDMFSGFWVFVLLMVVVLLMAAFHAAFGADLPRNYKQRTVTWYAAPANRPVLDYVTKVCRNDPGGLGLSRDCTNADRARILVAEEEARRHFRDLTPPTSPAYWRTRPEELRYQLTLCERTPAERLLAQVCSAARSVGGH